MPKPKRPTSKRTQAPATEWIGGVAEMPYDLPDAPGARTTLALWLELPSGYVVGSQLGHAPLDDLEEALRGALARPPAGPPRIPSRVRVDGDDAARRVREVLGLSVPVVVAETPEILDAAEDLLQHVMREGRTRYLLDGSVSASVLQTLFATARAFAELKPWGTLDESHVLRVDVPALGVDGAAAMVIGRAGMSRALLVFPSAQDLALYEAAAAAMHDDPSAMPEDMGSSVLSVNFEPEAEIDPRALAAIREAGYPLASRGAIPVVEQRDSTGAPRSLEAGELAVALAVLTGVCEFVKRHGADLKRHRPGSFEARTEVLLAEGAREVRVSFPHEAYTRVRDGLSRLAEAARSEDAPRTSARVGRNEPCPCGSGKKYKKCCAPLQAVPSTPPVTQPMRAGHDLDLSLVMRVHDFAVRELGNRHRAFDRAVQDPDGILQLLVPLSVYRTPVDGRPAAAHYMERYGAGLSTMERSWLELQMNTPLSVWEAQEVVPGERMTVRDLITGATCTVIEKSGTQSLSKRDVLLARVLYSDGQWFMCGCHPRTLGPSEADEVIEEVRKRMGLKKRAPLGALLGVEAEHQWVRAWEERVEAVDRARANVRLTNTDQDPLLLTADHFDIRAGARAEVERRIQQIPWASEPETDERGDTQIDFLRPGNAMHKSWENTHYGTMRVSDGRVLIETNSLLRADTLRSRLEGICGELVTHRLREHRDPTSVAQRGGPAHTSPPPMPPELDAIVRQEVQRMMGAWLDQSIPALGGKTPRQAVRTQKGRKLVDLLLRDIERTQGHASSPAMFDVSTLREELGLSE